MNSSSQNQYYTLKLKHQASFIQFTQAAIDEFMSRTPIERVVCLNAPRTSIGVSMDDVIGYVDSIEYENGQMMIIKLNQVVPRAKLVISLLSENISLCGSFGGFGELDVDGHTVTNGFIEYAYITYANT